MQAKRVRDLYAGESYQTKDGHTALGTKGLKAENDRLRAENERLERDNASKRAEGARIDERGRALKVGEERLAEDRAKLDDDRTEATRLLDGYDRPATKADYLPPHDPANIGERVVAEKRAHDDYRAAYHANGHKPPTVHEPGLREQKAGLDAGLAAVERVRAQAEDMLRRAQAFAGRLVSAALRLCYFADDVACAHEKVGLDASGWHGVVRWFGEASDVKPDDLDADALSPEAFDEAFEKAKEETRKAFRRKRATKHSAQSARRHAVHGVWVDTPKMGRGYDEPEL